LSIWIKSAAQLIIFGLGESATDTKLGQKASRGKAPKRDRAGWSGSVFPFVYVHKMKPVGVMPLASRGTVLYSPRLPTIAVAACIKKKL